MKSIFDKTLKNIVNAKKNIYCEKTRNISFFGRTHIVNKSSTTQTVKTQNSNCEKTKIIKLCQRSITQIVTKIKTDFKIAYLV